MGGITDSKRYYGWRNWATWNAFNTLTEDDCVYNKASECKSIACLKKVFAKHIKQVGYTDFKKELHNIDWNEILRGINYY